MERATISDLITHLQKQKEIHGDLKLVMDWNIDSSLILKEDLKFEVAGDELTFVFYPL